MMRKTRMLQKENNRLDEQILEENQEKFTDMICLCLSILFAINILLSRDTIEMIKNAIIGGQVNLNIAISAWTTLSVVVILFLANLIVKVIVKNALEKEKMQKRGAEIAGVIVVTLLLFVFAWVGRGTLFTVNIFVACAVTVALFGLHKVLENIV